MRTFDYKKIAEYSWDNEVLSYVAKIHECKGRQEHKTTSLSRVFCNLFYNQMYSSSPIPTRSSFSQLYAHFGRKHERKLEKCFIVLVTRRPAGAPLILIHPGDGQMARASSLSQDDRTASSWCQPAPLVLGGPDGCLFFHPALPEPLRYGSVDDEATASGNTASALRHAAERLATSLRQLPSHIVAVTSDSRLETVKVEVEQDKTGVLLTHFLSTDASK